MTVFGDLDVSTMTELPQGRAPIRTHVVPVAEKPRHLDRAWERIREEVAAGRQAFVVCPRIGEGDETDDDSAPPTDLDSSYDRAPRAVTEVAAVLGSEVLADLRIGVLHGRLPTDERDASMAAFVRGDLDVLVATTVVEVGVDVPTATVMVILDAERFGVSQLHQLRGRVGRGRDPALCLLVTDALPGTPTRERLDRVAETLDGFELSRLDLQTRREGDVLGATQSGRRSSLRLLEVIRHEKVIEAARGEATALVADDVTLSAYPALADQVTRLLQDERAEYLEKA